MRSVLMTVGCAAAVALSGCAKEDAGEAAAAAGRACMVSGQAEIQGQIHRIRDCVLMDEQMPRQAQAEICQGLADLPGQLGGGQRGKVQYLSACPQPSQGTCQNAFGRPDMVIHYYERSEQERAGLPLECGMYGGTWQPPGG
jgi:hypothetical protein